MPARLQELPVEAIKVLPQVRTRIDTKSLAELSASIREVGIQAPVMVLSRADRFELIAGERRLRAAIAAGLRTVPALILDESLSEAATVLLQLTENLQREPLGCVDAARGVRRMMELSGCSATEAAKRMGYSPASASRWLRLLDLPERVLAQVEAGKVTLSAAYALAGVRNAEQQTALAEESAKGLLSREALARKIKRIQRGAARPASRPVAKLWVSLGNRRSVVVAAPELGLPVVIELLESTLDQTRAALAKGLGIKAFQEMIRRGDRGAEGVRHDLEPLPAPHAAAAPSLGPEHARAAALPTDHVALGEMYSGTQVWGSTGSGKTSGSMAAICRAMFSRDIRAGAPCLCAKREDRSLYERYAREAGRQDDVMVFGPNDSSLRYNFLDVELARNDSGVGLVEGLTSLLLTATELLERSGTARGGGENEAYFRKAAAQLLRNCLEVLVLAYGTVTIPDLQKFIAGSPVSLEQVASPSWQEQSFCFQSLQRAERQSKSESKRADFELAVSFLLGEWAQLSSRTRSVVQSTLSSTLDVLSRGAARDLLSSPITNVRPEDSWNGAIVIVDIPILIYHDIAQLIAVIMKTCWQRAALRRDVSANPRPVCIIADESHLTTVNADWAFQVVARSTNTAVIAATQGLSNYLETFGPASEPAVFAMLANRQLHIHHQQNDTRLISWAQELVGRRKLLLYNGSGSQGDDWLAPLMGGSRERQVSAGFAEHYEFELQAQDFSSLRKGGAPHFEVDGIVIQGGKRFNATGRTWMPVTFKQHR